MPSKDPFKRMMDETRGLSSDDFVRMLEGDRQMRASDYVSIKELAAELGVSVRTLRRWNKLPDAPQRFQRSRRLMYRRADVQHWFEQRARRLGAVEAGNDTPADGSV
jgi:predicted DNA-binding transcriptional regulator AlpA